MHCTCPCHYRQNTAPKETKPAEVAPTVVLPQPMDTVPPLQPSPAKKQSTPRKSVSIHAFPSSQPSKPPVVKTVRICCCSECCM